MRLLLLLLAPFLALGAPAFEPVHFEPNRGQADSQFQFIARTPGALLLIGSREIVLTNSSAASAETRFQMEFAGANPASTWKALDPQPGDTSYILGNRAERWLHGVPHFGRLVRADLYPGIDLVLYSRGGNPEYDLALHPGADPRRITLRFSGERNLTVDPDGNLVVELPTGRLIQPRPALYEVAPDGSRVPVAGGWRITGRHRAAFRTATHKSLRPLIIDPVLISATYLGGEGYDRIIAADPRSLIVGTTTSTGFPGVNTAQHRGTDIFVYNPATQSTSIIGGSGDDVVTCARIGSYGYAWIGGYTNSRDLPLPTPYYRAGGYPAPIQTQYGGGDWDGFVMEIQLGNVAQGTYIGGSGDDRVLAIDSVSYLGFAAAGSTTSTDFPLAHAWQSQPGGGTDAFLTIMNSAGGVPLSTYLGGSVDDRALALAVSNSDLYLAGVTASTDWNTPGQWSGARAGPSDAFLLHAAADTNWTQVQAAQGAYFGGSANDRISALAVMSNGNVAAAGATSSPDISFPGAVQPAYGGGDSDAFAAQFTPTLQLFQGTYIGGSGAEEALALAASAFDEVLIGGRTSSSDFPVTAGSISTCGNGSADGFLIHFDSTGQPLYATCYGGSGTDRITSVASDGAQNDYFAGYTDSLDLPLQNPLQTTNAGGNDGFYGALSTPVIHVDNVTVGKDLTAPLNAVLGDPTNYVGVPVTIVSSDPTQVLLGTQPDDPGQPSVTISASADPTFTSRRALAYCLTDSASIPITLSAPGYPSRTVTVRCVPSGLYVNPAPVNTQSNGSSISVLPAALDPNTLQPLAYQNPRAGVAPISISLVNPNPSFVSFTSTSVAIDSFANLSQPTMLSFPYQTTGAGYADITLNTTSSFNFVPSNTFHIQSSNSQPYELGLYIPPMAQDLMAQISAGFGAYGPNATIPVTFTSSDPSKVLLMGGPGQRGQASVTVNYTSLSAFTQAWIEVLDASAPATVTASSPGYEPITVAVPYGTLTAMFSQGGNPSTSLQLTQGQSYTVQMQFFVAPYVNYGYSTTYELRPDATPIVLQIASSAPNVAAAPSSNLTTNAGSTFSASNLPISASAAGTTVYSVKVLSGAAVAGPPLTLSVTSNSLNLSGGPVGANLMGPIGVYFPGATGSPVPFTFSVSNPALALLSVDQQTPGQASVTLPLQYSNSGAVYLQALAASGSVDVTASADGYGSAKTTVQLVPSGFAFTAPSVTLPTYSFLPGISGYALDPTTLSPMAQQQVRPGLSGSLTLQVADPTIATVSPVTLPLASIGSGNSNLSFTAAGTGVTQISFAQPPGFTPPPGHGPLRVTAVGPSVSLQPGPICKNGQAGISIGASGSPSKPPIVTLTSSDPSKLLLSTSAYTLGSASVTIDLSSIPTYVPQGTFFVYMNAVDGPADVQITATASGMPPVTVNIPIGAPGLSLALPYTGSPAVTNTGTPLNLSLQTVALNSFGAVTGNVTLRPGLDSMPVTINSSNSTVGTVPTSPILNSLTASSPFTFKPLASGQTDLSIALPPGFLAAPPSAGRTLHVTVNGPSFVISDFSLGRDLQLGVQVNVVNGSGSIPADVDATLTSADPTRVLLSPDGITPGAASITVHFHHGDAPSRIVYVQALDQSGVVSVGISAAGYMSTTTNVTLYPTTFTINPPSISASLGGSPSTVQVWAVPASSNWTNGGSYQFRPGVSPAISAAASPAGIVNVSPASAAWPAGARELDFAIQPVAGGNANLALTVSAPYVAPSTIPITVTGGNLYLGDPTLTLGYDLQDVISVNTGQPGINVTVTSADPSRVLVSASPTAAGQASVTLSNASNQNASVYVQALSASGSVTLSFSAPNFQNATATILLSSSAVELVSPSLSALTPLSAPPVFQAKLLPYSGNNSPNYSNATLRPGAAPLTVQVMVSDPAVASVNPAQIAFAAGASTQSFTLQPAAPGSALVSLSVPAGFTDPVSLRQQLITVVGARATFSAPLKVGKDLVAGMFVQLSAAVGNPLMLTVTSSDPSRLLLANSANPNGVASLPLTVSPGASVSGGFSLIGLASSGIVNLTLSAPGLTTSNNSVTLEPSGLVFVSPNTSVSVNSHISEQISVYALNPQTLAPDIALPLRPGLSPATVSVTSSNSAVIASPYTVYLDAGASSTSIAPLAAAAGSTVLTIQTPAGFTTPSTGNTVSITVH